MPTSIPPRPQLPQLNPQDADFNQKMLEQQQIMANYQMIVQEAFNEQKEVAETASQGIKSKTDALEAIIRNLA